MIRRTGSLMQRAIRSVPTKALLNLAQLQNTAVRGEQTTIEAGAYGAEPICRALPIALSTSKSLIRK